MTKYVFLAFSSFVMLACSTSTRESSEAGRYQTTGSIDRLNPAINELIPEGAEIEILASGFRWSEGPLWVEDQQFLLFSDVPANTVYKWTEADSVTVFLSPSGYLGDSLNKREPGANGLALDLQGRLLLCQHGERQLARMAADWTSPSPTYEAITSQYEGKRFNSPNDVVVHSAGYYFFTDPPYGLDEWDTKELDFQGVYKTDEWGNMILLVDTLTRPNGIGLAPDERTLYIGVSDGDRARYYAYSLDKKGLVIRGKVLLDVTALAKKENMGVPDGLTVDSKGNLFATGPGGVLVISPEGVHLGTIRTGQPTANCAFSTDESVLYITANMHLMRVKLR
ncbi:MAG: SMP-30/gluconolactonase/LRE family protein [Cyclobacteriaceae bacterium]|nr:SMP-30/gluconolactonase/LRE family protein [Cyclobacteriaceae bacterium]